MLLEDPMRLKQRLEKGMEKKIAFDGKKIDEFKKMLSGIEIVRSSELIALCFEKGFFADELGQTRQALEAALFAMKYSGCAVSEREIFDYLKTQR